MRSRLLAGACLAGLMLLSACGQDQAAPTATTSAPAAPTVAATPAAQSTATTVSQAQATEQATSASTAESTSAPTTAATEAATAAPTQVANQAATNSQPPALADVTVEAGDTTARNSAVVGRTLQMPAGFHIKVYASDLTGVRWLGISPDGMVYATLTNAGQVVTLPDNNKDGVADSTNVFADNLQGVSGIIFHNGAVYVATLHDIIRLTDTNGDGKADKRETLATDLPGSNDHVTRTLAFSEDGTKLFVSAGSTCNVCVQDDPKQAAISLYSSDGKFEKIYAKGLRNAVGLLINPLSGELWATNNGRDGLGDNVPPETIYRVQEDADYGYPYCYGNQVTDTSQNPPAGYCAKTQGPAVELQAHSAPLGLAFYTGNNFPQQYNGDMFVAYHGSWNRTVPTGYKVVVVKMKNNEPDTSLGDNMVQDFITGWQAGDNHFGRPVDPLIAPNGSMLLTDDTAGVVYDIYYAP